MTTIFIENLKELVSSSLTARWGKLDNQIDGNKVFDVSVNGLMYKTDLSSAQKEKIKTLMDNIHDLTSSGDDSQDKETIKSYIRTAKKGIELVRGEHNESNVKSSTLHSLDQLLLNIDSFYDQLLTIPFRLLDVPFEKKPACIIYYYACQYFGEAHFKQANGNRAIREKKEVALVQRLHIIENSITDIIPLNVQKELAQSALDDLLMRNNQIVQPVSAGKLPLSLGGLSFLGMSVKKSTASTGTLKKLMNKAKEDIDKLEIEVKPRGKMHLNEEEKDSETVQENLPRRSTDHSKMRSSGTRNNFLAPKAVIGYKNAQEEDELELDDGSRLSDSMSSIN